MTHILEVVINHVKSETWGQKRWNFLKGEPLEAVLECVQEEYDILDWGYFPNRRFIYCYVADKGSREVAKAAGHRRRHNQEETDR